MRRAESIEAFLHDPVGKVLSGRSFALWVHDPTLTGYQFRGRIDEEDLPLLRRLVDFPSHPSLRAPYDVLLDAAGLQGMSTEAFRVLQAHLAHAQGVHQRVRRLAVLRPDGVAGATVAGLFYEGVRQSFHAALLVELEEALAWLGHRVRCHPGTLAALVGSEAPLRGRLRAHLETCLASATLPEVARALGLSARSLQRHLEQDGTTFQSELAEARVAAAATLLSESQTKLEAIARTVGLVSLSHFNRIFLARTGETPREFRARRRPISAVAAGVE